MNRMKEGDDILKEHPGYLIIERIPVQELQKISNDAIFVANRARFISNGALFVSKGGCYVS